MACGKIADNPTRAKLRDDIKVGSPIARLGVFLGKFGLIKPNTVEVCRRALEADTSVLDMPDRFNAHFLSRGWIAYDSLNYQIMKEAVELADEGELERAEHLLVEHFNKDTLDFFLYRLRVNYPFNLRYELIELYYFDYLDGRYHSTIPGLLTILDGCALDLGLGSLFGEKTSFTLPDSVVGHTTGLHALAKIFGLGRGGTNTETITIPFRHGILHGRDLGFANRTVAAKCWAALIALSDWVRDRERKPAKSRQTSLRETVESIQNLREVQKKIEVWKPRNIEIGIHIPRSGNPHEYDKETPERAIAEFFYFWQVQNFGSMVALINDWFSEDTINKRAGALRKVLRGKTLEKWEIVKIEEQGASLAVLTIALKASTELNELKNEYELRLNYESSKNDLCIPGSREGKWLLMAHGVNEFQTMMLDIERLQ